MCNNNFTGGKDAIKTYIEQTKVLISLSSAFVVAPAAALAMDVGANRIYFLVSELLFVFSVGMGYLVFSSIAGLQHKGVNNIYAASTRVTSILQIIAFTAGLIVFTLMIYSIDNSKNPEQADIVNVMIVSDDATSTSKEGE